MLFRVGYPAQQLMMGGSVLPEARITDAVARQQVAVLKEMVLNTGRTGLVRPDMQKHGLLFSHSKSPIINAGMSC